MQGSSSPSPAFRPLLVATTGAHLVDQTLMAAIPLLLAAGGASAGVIGAAVAAQAAAWLLVSLPAGALADRMSRRTILQIGGIAAVVRRRPWDRARQCAA
jgi:MFS family permease